MEKFLANKKIENVANEKKVIDTILDYFKK